MQYVCKLAGLALASLMFLAGHVQAEQFVEYGDYEIHYNAFNSSFVRPEIAKAAGILRGKRRALVNVSVLKKDDNGRLKPVVAHVSGEAVNLISQRQEMTFKKIDEGNAIYYIGSFGFTDDQVIRISLQVQPDPNKPAIAIKLEQKFFTDN